MKFLNHFFSRLYVPVSWSVLIFILLALPGSVLPSESKFAIPYFDKFVHATLFGVFVFTWCYYLKTKTGRISKRVIWFALVFLMAVAYGTGMEYLQKYVIPNRDFEEGDIIADTVGAGLGYLCCLATIAFKKEPSGNEKK